MLKIMSKKLSIWWKFKQLDRTYQPLLEKAVAFENRDALLKLEEQYWYQTACLLEERRELRKAQMVGTATTNRRRQPANRNPVFSGHERRGQFGSEREITYQHQTAAWKLIALVLSGLGMVGLLFWLFAINESTRLIPFTLAF
jgi:hypothetical protein